ncbi:hypothetical protein I0Q91_07770 [Halanaerobiaceae bacterium Z-7014]|uniref:ParB/Sulfiredoxin domain-containing protein n=1 Tax=Halonatronomonas betaini TaxID=2778430 RepID=A0A931ARU5_9FIRM|nr:hypothetical protein [Halonatronomonas betaini]MBF8436969.1 hypothetical protein [Halonatronomonas betaini]
MRADIKVDRQEGFIIDAINNFTGGVIPLIYRQYLRFSGLISDKVINKPFQVVSVPVELIQESISPYPEYYLDWLENERLVETPDVETVRKKKVLCQDDIRFAGKIADGDWDLARQDIESMISYIAFKERFFDGLAWEDTVYYRFLEEKAAIARAQNLELPFPDNFDKPRTPDYYFDYYLGKLKYWEELYYEIKGFGYKNQATGNSFPRSLHSSKAIYEGLAENEIEIAVARGGELLFVDGRHRFVIAKLLGVKNIPVIVNLWHREFIEKFRAESGQEKLTPSVIMNWLLGNIKV